MPIEQPSPSRRAVLAGALFLPLAGGRAEARAASAPDYYERAARLAGEDPVLRNLVRALSPGAEVPQVKAPKPLRTFDNVAVVSTSLVSATAIVTSRGVILIDALNSADEAEQILVPQLRSVGVNPSAIKYVVVSHGHRDHFGGAGYLARRFGARVMMHKADRALAGDALTPDLDIADGRRLTLGDTTVTFHHTPGHTPGTVSMIFPVRWKGRPHTAMLWGGTNPPAATKDKRTYVASVLAFAAHMRRARVDVELNNHLMSDHGLQRLEELRRGGAANPFVVGEPRAQRFMQVMEAMLRGRIVTDGKAG
ncbi:MBL fold metallo-hydrolase [Nonomuraea terrae]|uniref:MBL fold metallo-hydrolase n=1 Tax=Nonomuraea terrae TaxID=2530383 RepID=A0A4R4Y8Q1_9ACTN|nr:MBL fold metallo-hydrolase [Nonomuraea terrae]TDD40805.1 MBL fold metallo-hydrolase [Nonomuraea terrae]